MCHDKPFLGVRGRRHRKQKDSCDQTYQRSFLYTRIWYTFWLVNCLQFLSSISEIILKCDMAAVKRPLSEWRRVQICDKQHAERFSLCGMPSRRTWSMANRPTVPYIYGTCRSLLISGFSTFLCFTRVYQTDFMFTVLLEMFSRIWYLCVICHVQ